MAELADLHASTPNASMSVSATSGGRLASLIVDGHQLLVTEDGGGSDDLRWGSYPMVPWAGRVRDGLFTFADREVNLPKNLPPHSAHGVGFTSSWDVIDDQTIGCSLGDPWPFSATVTQRFELDESGLTTTMTVQAAEPMPVMVGWHPWFNRFLSGTDGVQVPADLRFGPASMYELDDGAIPTGRLVEQPPGPWDNCFTSLPANPRIGWPGLLDLELSSSCDHWVIFDEPDHALCVEPQSAAPDVFNRQPSVITAGGELTAWYRIAWS